MDSAGSSSKQPPNLTSTPSDSNTQKAALRQFKALSLQIVRWAQGFLEAQKLPYVANKACELYLSEADKAYQAKCRQLLRTRLELNPTQLHRFAHTALGRDLLNWLERFFHVADAPNQAHSFQELLLQMASDPEGLSLLSFLRRPDAIRPNLDRLLFAAKRVEWLLRAAEATMLAVQELAIAESALSPDHDFSTLTDIRQPGPYQVRRFQLMLDGAQHPLAETHLPPLQVFCYRPDPWPEGKVPVVMQSHGLASHPEDLAPFAQHLASYGYFVAAPLHPGSDAEQVRKMLAGSAQEVFERTEFIDRPLAISQVLDELEHRNAADFEGKLILDGVGMMGYSFGAYTAFALAGATIHFETLEMACGAAVRDPNPSLLLQCQALGLPRQPYRLQDDRIQAVLSIDSVGSEVFGPEGIAAIQIPVLLLAGSHDTTAPLALEQIRIFQWLTAPEHYLALMQSRSHIQDVQRLIRTLDLQIKLSPQSAAAAKATPFETYIKATSLAFFSQHLAVAGAGTGTVPPLDAAYAASISQSGYDLWLISQRSHPAFRQYFQHLQQPDDL